MHARIVIAELLSYISHDGDNLSRGDHWAHKYARNDFMRGIVAIGSRSQPEARLCDHIAAAFRDDWPELSEN